MPEIEKEYHLDSDHVSTLQNDNDEKNSKIITQIETSNDNKNYQKFFNNYELDDNLKNNTTTIENVTESEIKTLNYHRPFTAPPDPVPRSILRTNSEPLIKLSLIDNNNKMTQDNYDEEIELSEIKSLKQCNSELNDKSDKNSNKNNNKLILNNNNNDHSISSNIVTTWHAHVYAKPPKTPTPHSIGDILGWKGDIKLSPQSATEVQDTSALNQILSVRLKAAVSDDYRQKSNYITRCGSLSESSEDDSGICDQPLNLCLSKSRDTSPSSSIGKNSIRLKKGKSNFWYIINLTHLQIFLKRNINLQLKKIILFWFFKVFLFLKILS